MKNHFLPLLTIWLNYMVKKQIDESTEQRILLAAKKVFMTKGMAGARMQDIADEAGINKAMLHYYFRSKEKLFETIFKEVVKEFLPKINLIFESDKSLFEKIEMFCREYIDQIRETPYLPVFILNEINQQPEVLIKKMWGNRKPPINLFFSQVQNEIKKGIIKPVHPAQLLMNMLSLCIFPFAAKPILELVGGISKKQFDELMEERKTLIPELIIVSIKK
jgi:TetR/AcrR family transcriptional regulator